MLNADEAERQSNTGVIMVNFWSFIFTRLVQDSHYVSSYRCRPARRYSHRCQLHLMGSPSFLNASSPTGVDVNYLGLLGSTCCSVPVTQVAEWWKFWRYHIEFDDCRFARAAGTWLWNFYSSRVQWRLDEHVVVVGNVQCAAITECPLSPCSLRVCNEHVCSQKAEYIKILKVTIKCNNNNNNSKTRYMLKSNRYNKKSQSHNIKHEQHKNIQTLKLH